MTTNTYKCPKCAGLGILSQYRGILGGVCFSCNGAGFKVGAAPVKSPIFEISAIRKEDGARVLVFATKAKTAEAAVAKAMRILAGGNGYVPTTAQVAA